MHASLSWYLSGTPDVTPEKFLDAAERFLKNIAAERELPFPSTVCLRKLGDVPAEALESAEGILQVIRASDRANHYTALSLSNRNPDTAWTLDCVLWQNKEDAPLSGFRIDLRRKTPENRDALTSRLPEWLVREGLASTEPPATLPLLTMNTAALSSTELPPEYRYLCREERIEAASHPPYRIESPLLPRGLEFRFADQAEKGALSETDTTVLLPVAPTEGTLPEEVAQTLAHLAAEAIRRLPCPDFATVSRLLRHRDNSSAVSVPVTRALADRLRGARRANGLTQGDLADLTARFAKNREQASVGLLISRIETMRLHRIETEKLLLIAKCLGLDESELLRLSDESGTKATLPATPSLPGSPLPSDARINFCWACGAKRPSHDGNFCTFCGQKLQ